jgi:hypothetical protein
MSGNRRLRTAALVLLCGLGLSLTNPGAGTADTPFGAVDARASADGLRLGLAMKKFLIVENFVDAGGPSAQARLTSTGTESFAALPDPGGLVIGYNTFVGLALGSGLPFEYPFYAAAKYPGSPEHEVADPGGAYKVSARTAVDGADALAQMRPTAGDAAVSGVLAHSAIQLDGGTVTATSETGADLVALANGAVKLSGVVSRSVTTRVAGRSEPTTETSLAVDLITVNDLRIRYGSKGFEFLGTPVPAPSDAVGAALTEALKPLGIQIGIVQPETIAGGAKAAMLELRQGYPLPTGESQIVLRLGGATSSITAEDAVAAPDLTGSVPPGAGVGPSDPAGDDANAGIGTGGAVTPGSRLSTFPAGSGPLPGSGGASGFAPSFGSGPIPGTSPATSRSTAPATTGEVLGDGTASGAAAASPTVTRARLAGHRTSVEGPYAALVAGGLAIVLLSAAWARRGAAAAIWAGQ